MQRQIWSSVETSKNKAGVNVMNFFTGFEPRTSGIGSDRSANWVATTARQDFSHAIVIHAR